MRTKQNTLGAADIKQAAMEYEQALQAYQEGALAASREHCERAKLLQEKPKVHDGLIDTLLLEAKACRFLGNTDQAIALLSQAAKLCGHDHQLQARVAWSAFLVSLDRGSGWEPWLLSLQNLRSHSHEIGCVALLAEALDQAAKGKLPLACGLFSELSRDAAAQDLCGDLERSWALALLSAGELEEAKEHFIAARLWFEARHLVPELASLRVDNARLLVEAEDAEAAIKDLNVVMDDLHRYGMAPAICDACALLVRATLRLERYEEAFTAAGVLERSEKMHDVASVKARAFIWLAWATLKKKDGYGASEQAGRARKIAEASALAELRIEANLQAARVLWASTPRSDGCVTGKAWAEKAEQDAREFGYLPLARRAAKAVAKFNG